MIGLGEQTEYELREEPRRIGGFASPQPGEDRSPGRLGLAGSAAVRIPYAFPSFGGWRRAPTAPTIGVICRLAITSALAAGIAVCAIFAPTAEANEIIDLGPASAFEPLAINNSRVIVSGEARDGSNHALPPRLWDDGKFVNVPVMDAAYANDGGALLDINDSGLVVGEQTAKLGGPEQLFEEPRAFTWQYDAAASTPAPLTVLQQFGGWGPDDSIPFAVNGDGDVVGSAQESQGAFDPFGGNAIYGRAVIWRHGSSLLQRIETGQQNTPGDPHQGYAIAINDGGTILGVNGPATLSPVMWTPIPLTNDYTRAATAARSPETNANNPNGQGGHPLNDNGQYITVNFGGSVNWHRFDPGGPGIPLPAGFVGRSIADNGRVVGLTINGSATTATLIEPIGLPLDLNTLNPKGSPFSALSSAEDINDAGDIIGIGLVGGVKHGYLLKADGWTVDDAGDDPDTDTGDGQCLTEDGRCSLRAAIQQANATPGGSETPITFSIAGDPTITPDDPLPAITRSGVAIDGRTQSGGPPTIDGSSVPDVPALRLRASDVTVKGIRVRDVANAAAIEVGTAGGPVTGVTIGGSHIDVDACARPCNAFTGSRGAITVPDPASRVRIVGNVMTDDGPAPIDLGADGRTPNDRGDHDGRLNFPVGVTGVVDPESGDLRVTGAITPIVKGASIDVYAQPAGGAAAPARYLGDATTSDSGAFTLTVPAAEVDVGKKIFSATETVGDTTSELSPVCGDPVAAGEPDADADGLCDSWEHAGLDYDDDGTADLTLPGASLDRRDLYLEVDAMAAADGHRIAPTQAAIGQVVEAFDRAPVDGGAGVALHVERDEADVAYVDPVVFGGSGPTSLWGIRFGGDPDGCAGAFGTKAQRGSANCWATLGAKRLTTRYALFADSYTDDPAQPTQGSSGIANGIGGNALIVSEATFNPHFKILAGGGPQFCSNLDECTDRVDAETLMHEFGHLLGLRHGGSDDENYKPNYLSVMNYAFQFANRTPDRPLDYSRWELPTLDAKHLNESLGILGGQAFGDLTTRWPHTNHTANHDFKCTTFNVPTSGAIDFNRDGSTNPSISVGITDGQLAKSAGTSFCRFSADPANITGFDDWANLRYSLRDGEGFQQAAGAEPTDPAEDTEAAELAVAATMDSDGDGRSNFDEACVPIPGAPDANGNGVLDDCEAAPPGGGGGGSGGGGSGSGPGPPGSGGPAPRDTAPPTIRKPKVSPGRFRVAPKRAKKPAATLTFAISEPGTVTVAAERVTKGHRVGKRCSTKARRGKACTIAVRVAGTLTAKATRAGTVTVKLSGRLGGRALRPGRYELVITVRDTAGNRSKPARVAISIR